MQIFELIYYSIASPSLNRNDISDILEVSHKNNPKNNLTGCLLYHDDAFIQILEGEQEVIESLYLKIEKDQRHYNVRRVYDDNKVDRLFKNWSMAFFDLNEDDTVDKSKLIYRKAFIEILNQTERSTVASQLFWHISHQLIK
jgi:Sensors of blue-light using FAD